jgi:hypothetical protein
LCKDARSTLKQHGKKTVYACFKTLNPLLFKNHAMLPGEVADVFGEFESCGF